MPHGPKGEKGPADVIGNAVKVMRIATGEKQEEYDSQDKGKDKAAAELGGRVKAREGDDAGAAGGNCPEDGEKALASLASISPAPSDGLLAVGKQACYYGSSSKQDG